MNIVNFLNYPLNKGYFEYDTIILFLVFHKKI